MKKVKGFLNIVLLTVLIGTISLISHQRMEAEETKEIFIWPDQFIAANSNQVCRQYPDYIQPILPPLSQEHYTNVNFFFTLDKFNIKEIIGFIYYYQGISPEAYSVVNLNRAEKGKPTTTLLIYASKQGETGGVMEIDGTPFANADLTLKPDSRYYFHLNIDNNKGLFYGIRLIYR